MPAKISVDLIGDLCYRWVRGREQGNHAGGKGVCMTVVFGGETVDVTGRGGVYSEVAAGRGCPC